MNPDHMPTLRWPGFQTIQREGAQSVPALAGESRWEVFEMPPAQAERARALATFFEAFTPQMVEGVGRVLEGESLTRLHATLRQHGHTSKSYHTFMRDADPDGEGSMTLYKLHKWFFREAGDREPPKPPTWSELRRPIVAESRADYLQEEVDREREKKAMLERAGKRVAYADM